MKRSLYPKSRSSKRALQTLAFGLCLAMSATTLPAANADDLSEKKQQLEQKIERAKEGVKEASREATEATNQYRHSKAELAEAEAKLAKAKAGAQTAAERHKVALAEADAAKAALNAAKVEVSTTTRKIALEKDQIAAAVRENTVYANPLFKLAVLFEDLKTSDVSKRIQYSQAVFQTRSIDLDRLTALQIRLEAAQVKAYESSYAAEAARSVAEKSLTEKKTQESTALSLKRKIDDLVASNNAKRITANAQVEKEKARVAAMDAEAAALDRRIANRVAQLKRAEQNAKETKTKPKTTKKTTTSKPKPKPKAGYQSNTSLYWPAIGRAGSPFGMRYHPILHYYRMHWGTDIGASCGSPLYAAGNGVMTDVYWSRGYGNRAILDVGKVSGSYLSIGYAHATRYIVRKGQRVRKGQVIGYVGSTGLSTECHLHLEVWQNGRKVNPMRWF